MQANLTANANRIPELPENCFYFVDTPKAIRERDGLKARDLNPKRKRPQRRARSGLDRKGVPLSRAERVANLAWFYSACADNEELSPFDD